MTLKQYERQKQIMDALGIKYVDKGWKPDLKIKLEEVSGTDDLPERIVKEFMIVFRKRLKKYMRYDII